MARRRRTAAGLESLEDLARKTEILERELALQREALEKLRQMSASTRKDAVESESPAARRTA
jgi:hypothetical protein